MGLLDVSAAMSPKESIGFTFAFSILAAACCVAVAQTVRDMFTREFYGKHSVRILFPWASAIMLVENTSLAARSSGRDLPNVYQDIVYALDTTLVPGLLLCIFDISYLVHKSRSVQFCGIYEGKTRSKNPCKIAFLKMCIRILALGLLVIAILVNFNIVGAKNDEVGRAGMYSLFTRWNLQLFLSLVPPSILVFFSFYFSTALWKYGTENSMVVHASMCNPWFAPFFGTLALAAGLLFGPHWFPLLSNLGYFVFVESILSIISEVEKDWDEANDLQDFLGVISGGQGLPERPKVSSKKDSSGEKDSRYTDIQDDVEMASFHLGVPVPLEYDEGHEF